ncbi:MAG TPA: hypothetical protein VH088_19110 [Terriglobales bacterium]|jgi:hypothetical protein|nr:hypothetical protein [Terriglobales bacterium]
MHTLKIIAGGFLLLAVFLLAGRYLVRGSMATPAKYFIPLWFVMAGINMWIGVSHARYSVRDEAPIFLLNFVPPAAAAAVVIWRGR